MGNARPRILLAVTSDVSLKLMGGFPEYLAEHGWDVHVVSAPGTLLDRLAALPGITAHPLAMKREPSPFHDLIALARWVRLLWRVRPDVLSAGTPKAGLLGMLAGRLVRVPYRVYHLRGLRLETTRGVRRRILALTERVAAGSAHRVLSVSNSLMAKAVELGLVDRSKILVLGAGSSNGVDVKAFGPARFTESQVRELRESLGLVERVPIIGFVGRLTPDKGVEVLTSALDLLATRGIDHQLLIVGGHDGSGERTSLGDVGIGRRAAIFTGSVAEPAIYYQLMDVLCLPTRREGFPNVVLEAAASGVPTVTTTATGAVDSVIDGETGFLVSVDSEREICERLAKILTDEDLRWRMGVKAQRHVQNDYERLKVWESLAAFYRQGNLKTRESRR